MECRDWILLGFCVDDLQGFVMASFHQRGFEKNESFPRNDEILKVVDLVKLDA